MGAAACCASPLQVASWSPQLYQSNPAVAALHALSQQLGQEGDPTAPGGSMGSMQPSMLSAGALREALSGQRFRPGGCGHVPCMWRAFAFASWVCVKGCLLA